MSLDMKSSNEAANELRGIVRRFDIRDGYARRKEDFVSIAWYSDNYLYEVTQTDASFGKAIPRSISLYLYTNRSLIVAWSAARLGCFCSYFDATVGRVTGFKDEVSEGTEFLHANWVNYNLPDL